MNKVFKLKYVSGPHGDACTTYNVELFGEQTLQDFLYALDDQEWGQVRVNYLNKNMENFDCATNDEKYSSHFDIEYKYGNIVRVSDQSLYDKFKDTVLTNNEYNWANGGWSCMNYWLRID